MVFITIVIGANLNQLISWGPHIAGIPQHVTKNFNGWLVDVGG